MGRSQRTRTAGTIITCLAAALIAVLTLLPGSSTGRELTFDTTDLVFNTVLFIPFGIGLALWGRGVGEVAVIGVSCGIGIELAQLLVIPGRDASIHDVATNALGTVIGAWLVHHWPERRTWWPWAGGSLSALVSGYLIIGARLAAPAQPGGALWFSQWQHELAGIPPFQGRVIAVTLEGEPLPDGLIVRSSELRERIATRDSSVLTVSIETGPPTHSGPAQIAGITAGQSGLHLVNTLQNGTSLIVRRLLAMAQFGLRSPGIVIDSALPPRTGDTVSIQVTTSRQQVLVTVDGGTHRQSRFRLAPDLQLVPFLPVNELTGLSLPPPLVRALACFVAFGLVSAGWYRRFWRQGLVMILWLVAVPLLFGLSSVSLLSLSLAMLGVVSGNLVARKLNLG